MTSTKTAERSAAQAEVRELLTRELATERGLVPHGHVWDERAQTAMPLGLAVREEAIERGEDLEARLKRMARDREIVLRFIREQMVESDYDPKTKKPIKGRMHDYYILPGYDKKCATKQGGEKLAQFFNLRRAKTESVERTCTKEFAMAAVRVELVDKWGMPAGSGEAAASTAETGFQQAAAKYGQRRDQQGKIVQEPDYRGAFNDVLSRAGKRSFIQAIIYATATDDIFDATGTVDKAAAAAGVDDDEAPAKPKFRFPEKFGKVGGKLVEGIDSEELLTIANWCRTRAKNPKAVAPILEAVEEELERRRPDADDDQDGPV